MVLIFPLLYIPVINRVVFKHEGISWEWGIVFVETVVFFVGCEAWKFAKRAYFRRAAKKKTGGVVDLESRVFGKYLSIGRSDSEGGDLDWEKPKKGLFGRR